MCLDLDFLAYPSALWAPPLIKGRNMSNASRPDYMLWYNLWAPPLTKGRNMRHTSVSLHHAKVHIIFHLAKNYDKKNKANLIRLALLLYAIK